jgi:hypothetical protein
MQLQCYGSFSSDQWVVRHMDLRQEDYLIHSTQSKLGSKRMLSMCQEARYRQQLAFFVLMV